MKNLILLSICVFLSLTGCSQASMPETSFSLAQKYQSFFPIGAAVSPGVLKSSDSTLVISQYNSLVCENQMKPASVHPQENTWTFNDADYVASFAKRHQMKLRGHTLVWHSQTPDWFFKDGDQEVSKEVLKERLRKHIQTVVSRYEDEVYCWDVVNEALSDTKGEYFRTTSPWFKILGEEFIELAFRYAHEANPNAKLFYNDYSTTNPDKMDKIIRLVKSLQEKGIPIDGIGMQGHWKIGAPTKEQIETTIELFSALGVMVQITEMDVSVYQSNKDQQQEMTPDLQQKQADYYKMCFDVFRAKKDKISGVTFWGVADNKTWLDNFPVKGRKNYPFLFDTNLQPKKAFYEVVNF